LRGRLLQILPRTLATSSAAAGLGRALGALMVSILSMGLASRRSWRTAHRQKEETAARLRLRVTADSSPMSARNTRIGSAVRSASSPSQWAVNWRRSPR
jgi:hypothetical protein